MKTVHYKQFICEKCKYLSAIIKNDGEEKDFCALFDDSVKHMNVNIRFQSVTCPSYEEKEQEADA
jgi:hypothetical protein